MAVGKLQASPMYVAPVLLPPAALVSNRRVKRKSRKEEMLEWVIPILTLIATALAMWFVVTDGWFQLFGFWAL